MDIALTQEQFSLRDNIRSYMAKLMTPELVEELSGEQREGGGPQHRKALQQMGSDGWIVRSWPKEYGGQDAGPIEQYIFCDEVIRAGFPYPFLTTDGVGPVLANVASDEIREAVVQPILRGECVIAIGYSEPAAGTDLASLTTRAERRNDKWVINGQKIWTSYGNVADYVWLAARTDQNAVKKHQGISMFLVPTSAPGFSFTPINTLGVRTTATYYEDIELEDKWQVGPLNQGWRMITEQLNRERLSLVNHGPCELLYERVATWAAQTDAGNGSGSVIDQPWVRTNLATVKSGLEVLRLVCFKQAWSMSHSSLGMDQASAAKIYGSEFFVEAWRLLLEIVGQAGALCSGSEGAILQGDLEHRYRSGSVLTFGGGTNEVQRDIVAAAGLLMPRYR
ncbi:MAG: alkylation response protein AidB-like acyl-CoA dehydrogenase [Halioglobus sp.]|jgi:alkylation response protein AidB-like acyl-CoA dehydrogenase